MWSRCQAGWPSHGKNVINYRDQHAVGNMLIGFVPEGQNVTQPWLQRHGSGTINERIVIQIIILLGNVQNLKQKAGSSARHVQQTIGETSFADSHKSALVLRTLSPSSPDKLDNQNLEEKKIRWVVV